MPDTSVKFIHSEMTGAPVMSGTAGALIAVLNACLIDGFGTGTLDSLVIASSVATAARSGGHPFEVGTVGTIAGITGGAAALNGERKILSVTPTTYTFDATGVSDQTATGTITHKVAPLSTWTKPFTGTNLAAYKSTDAAGTGMYLRVNDADAREARIIGYETMSDMNTGTGDFPTNAQQAGGLYVTRSTTANSTARSWILCGDSRAFYIAIAYNSAVPGTGYETFGFGDLIPTLAGDDYGAFIAGKSLTGISGAPSAATCLSYSEGTGPANGMYGPRSYTATGSSIKYKKSAPMVVNYSASSIQSGSNAHGLVYPNGPNGGLYVAPLNVLDDATDNFRGVVAGLYHFPQKVWASASLASKDTLTGVTGLSGKTLRVVSASTTQSAGYALETTGPWR